MVQLHFFSLGPMLPMVVSALSNDIKTLVAFGDSYTDQSRIGSWTENGTAPPPHYQEVYPPKFVAANGGTSWVRYAEIDGDIQSYNYAVSGASCDNNQTGRPHSIPAYPGGYWPDVNGYEIPALFTDWTTSSNPNISLDADTTVYSIWVGTNDVGVILNGNQTAGVTVENVTQCTVDWARKLYNEGARNFIFQNMLPLELTPLYSPANTSARMRDLVNQGNSFLDQQVPAIVKELGDGVQAALFDSHALFTDMYKNPSAYLNGTAPLNVTGDYVDDGSNGSPDSYLWYNNLHPSEAASRIVAQEIVNTLAKHNATYATYFGSSAWTAAS